MRLNPGDIFKWVAERFYLLYSVGILGFFIAPARPLMEVLTPPVLFLTAISALALLLGEEEVSARKRLYGWLLTVFITTMAAEFLGVKYGLFFGSYGYGRALGPGVAGVPLIIGIKWIIVITGSAAISAKFTVRPLPMALMSGALAVIFDIVMEPAAMALGFWDWKAGIPIKNYVSWFVITFIFSGAYALLRLRATHTWSAKLLKAQFMFFLAVRAMMAVGIF